MTNAQLLQKFKEKIELIRKQMRPLQDELTNQKQNLLETIALELDEYLGTHKVKGKKYTLDRLDFEGDCVTFWLNRASGDPIDEDYESDKSLDSFLELLSLHAGVRRIGVPYYYYPK